MNAIQLLIRKKDPQNFEPLTLKEFPCSKFINIINHNLAIVDISDDDLRIGVEQILQILESKVFLEKLFRGVYSKADLSFWQNILNKNSSEESILIVNPD